MILSGNPNDPGIVQDYKCDAMERARRACDGKSQLNQRLAVGTVLLNLAYRKILGIEDAKDIGIFHAQASESVGAEGAA